MIAVFLSVITLHCTVQKAHDMAPLSGEMVFCLLYTSSFNALIIVICYVTKPELLYILDNSQYTVAMLRCQSNNQV